jgi:hypothetical protein
MLFFKVICNNFKLTRFIITIISVYTRHTRVQSKRSLIDGYIARDHRLI